MPATCSSISKLLSVILMTSMLSCQVYSGRSFKPAIPGYNDKKKTAYILHQRLLEISGQVNLPSNRFAAIEDEEGKIFIFGTDPSQPIEKIKFAGKGDYEDITQVDSVFYVIESNGDLHEVIIDENGKAKSHQYKFKLEKKIEFESLVYYPSIRKLVLITKDHALDKDALYAYSFDLASKAFDPEPFFIIPKRDILRKMKDYSAQCKPSAAALHPITGKLILLASIGKSIIQCTPEGKVEYAWDLNPDQFPQPEGISFASNGDMYISNEGLQGKATMIKYPYQP